jgi:hypothetical protein
MTTPADPLAIYQLPEQWKGEEDIWAIPQAADLEPIGAVIVLWRKASRAQSAIRRGQLEAALPAVRVLEQERDGFLASAREYAEIIHRQDGQLRPLQQERDALQKKVQWFEVGRAYYTGRIRDLEEQAAAYTDRLDEAGAKVRALEAEREALKQELARWQTCENCGETMSGPGQCDVAVREKLEGDALIVEDLLGDGGTIEKLHAERDALKEKVEWFDKRCAWYARHIDAQAAEIRRLQVPHWQEIATAPKDGVSPSRPIDLWLRIPASPRSFGMSDAFRVVDCWRNARGYWVHDYRGEETELAQDYITHWAPVVAAVASQEGEP